PSSFQTHYLALAQRDMTITLNRKVFAGIVLAVSVALTNLLSPAKADTEQGANGVTVRSLLSGVLSTTSAEAPVPELLAPEVLVPGAVAPVTAQRDPLPVAQSNPVGDTFAPLTEEEVRQQLLINPGADPSGRLRPLPASTFLVPTAYGADWGDAFVGAAVNTNGNTDKFDGSASLGVGLGSAINFVGLEINSGILSLDGFADDGTLGFKLHKVFPSAGNLGVAVGWENPVKWGAASDEEETYYGVVSNRFDLRRGQVNPLPLTVSVGVGTGAYRSAGAVADNNNDPNVFGSVSLRVQPELSVISSWTGRSLGIAASAAPFKNPFVFTIGLSDITDNTPEGIRMNASVGYGYSF
ncbi:MAG: hypothetical protein WBB01_06345, partial [Phormidesmis sp.]